MPSKPLLRTLFGVTWIFFAATIYLVLASAIHPWFVLPDLGDYGFVFVCVLFTILHCALMEGARRTALFFAISAIVSYALEEIGVRTGAVYGFYHYSNMLGSKLGHVPIIIPLAWFMMIYPSWLVARTILEGLRLDSLPGRTALAVLGAWVITGWDMVMDPGMAAGGNWVWEHGGAYFGVPRHNYLGWLLTTFLVYWIAGWLWREPLPATPWSNLFESLPILVYAAIAIRYLCYVPIPAVQLIALFTMGTPALIAILRLSLRHAAPPLR